MEQAVGTPLIPLGQVPPPLGNKVQPGQLTACWPHHLAIEVIVIVFRVHTATCATSTALTGASSTLVP